MDELEKIAFAEIVMKDLGVKLAKHLTKGANVEAAAAKGKAAIPAKPSFNWGKFRSVAAKGMRKIAFQSPTMISRFAKAAPHLNEVAGLGVLAVPSVAGLAGNHMEDKTKDMMEVGGLGMLAAPSAYHAGKSFIPKATGIAGRTLGRLHA